MGKARLFIADDHTLLLDAFRNLLESEFDVVGTAEDGRSAVEVAAKLAPDVILLDIGMPRMNGIEAGRLLHKALPQTKIIFLTMYADSHYISQALSDGARGYVLKRSAASELVAAIRTVLAGDVYVTPYVADSTVRSLMKGSRKALVLSPRQREVLQLVAEGHSVKEIATELKISPRTVEFHQNRIRETLGIRSIAELTQYAIRSGLLPIPTEEPYQGKN